MFACCWLKKQLVDASTQTKQLVDASTQTETETNVAPQLACKAKSQDMQHMIEFYDRVDSLFNSAAKRQSDEKSSSSSVSHARHVPLHNSREFTES